MSESSVTVTRRGRVLHAELDRVAKRNSLDRSMLDDLHAALDEAESGGFGVLVISGAGGVFCAGADLATYARAIDDLGALGDFGHRAKTLMHRLARSSVIVVASVDGVAMGGGFELVLSSDIVIATKRARFGLPEIRLGLIPGWDGTQRLARHIGPNRAKEAIMLASVLSATELSAAGLVNRLVEDEELAAVTSTVADSLAAQAPLALAAAKRAITAAVEPDIESAGSEQETRELLALFASDDGREGIAAFLEKRPAEFSGS